MTAPQATMTRRRDVPAALLQPAEWAPLLRAALADWAVIGLCWGGMAVAPWWSWPLGILVVAGRLQALGVVMHEACHMKRQEPSAASRCLEFLAGYPVTTTLAAMRYHHLRHHRHSGLAIDPYFKAGASHEPVPAVLARLRGLLLPPAWILRAYLGWLALCWPRWRNPYGRIFLGDRSGGDLRTHPELLRCLRAEPAQALFFLALLPLAWRFPLPVMVGYGLPLLMAGLLNAHRVVAEHVHVPVVDRLPATLVATTRTHEGGFLSRALLYPRQIGYHTAHHLHPTAALQRLPALHAWYLEHEPAYRLPAGSALRVLAGTARAWPRPAFSQRPSNAAPAANVSPLGGRGTAAGLACRTHVPPTAEARPSTIPPLIGEKESLPSALTNGTR
jgi:fatty acid desaturase